MDWILFSMFGLSLSSSSPSFVSLCYTLTELMKEYCNTGTKKNRYAGNIIQELESWRLPPASFAIQTLISDTLLWYFLFPIGALFKTEIKFFFLTLEGEELWSPSLIRAGKENWTVDCPAHQAWRCLSNKVRVQKLFSIAWKKMLFFFFPFPKGYGFGGDQAFYIMILLLSAISVLDKEPSKELFLKKILNQNCKCKKLSTTTL